MLVVLCFVVRFPLFVFSEELGQADGGQGVPGVHERCVHRVYCVCECVDRQRQPLTPAFRVRGGAVNLTVLFSAREAHAYPLRRALRGVSWSQGRFVLFFSLSCHWPSRSYAACFVCFASFAGIHSIDFRRKTSTRLLSAPPATSRGASSPTPPCSAVFTTISEWIEGGKGEKDD